MTILGIETSCDDTSVAIVQILDTKIQVLTSAISSQIKLHNEFGGVFPALAAREHSKHIGKVLTTALAQGNHPSIDLIAVTSGPGLISSLLVGSTFAQTYAWRHNIPIIGVNHIEGHIYSNWLTSEPIKDKEIFPAVCLVVSGGHTQLILMTDHGKYSLIGQTLDDAAGEAFDKIARMLGLEYPGGPAISKLAADFDPEKKLFNIALPRPMLHSGNFDFSFSGLKTAALYLIRDLSKNHAVEDFRQEVAHETERAIVETLVTKTIKAALEHNARSVMLSGGVSANKLLREQLSSQCKEKGLTVVIPDPVFTTDNAAMIAVAGYMNYQILKKEGRLSEATWERLVTNANWEIV